MRGEEPSRGPKWSWLLYQLLWAAVVLQSLSCGVLPLSKLLLSRELWCKPEQGQTAQSDGTAAPQKEGEGVGAEEGSWAADKLHQSICLYFRFALGLEINSV